MWQRFITYCCLLSAALVSSFLPSGALFAQTPTLDTLRQYQAYNESAVADYSGKATVTNTLLVELGEFQPDAPYGIIDVLETPLTPSRGTAEFSVDSLRGGDYKTVFKIQWQSDVGVGGFQVLERKIGESVETVVYEDDGTPKEAIIFPPEEAQSLLLWRDPIARRSGIGFANSAAVDGFSYISLAQSMEDSKWCYVDPTIADIEGEPSIRVVTLSEKDNSRVLAYTWLGENIGYTITKQIVIQLLPTSDPRRIQVEQQAAKAMLGIEKDELTIQDYAEIYQRVAPMSMIVSYDFAEISPDIWVPARTIEYSFFNVSELMQRQSLDNIEDIEAKYASLLEYDEHVSSLDTLKYGKALFSLRSVLIDTSSLEINAGIDSSIWEDNIVPLNIPVTNRVFGVSTKERPSTRDILDPPVESPADSQIAGSASVGGPTSRSADILTIDNDNESNKTVRPWWVFPFVILAAMVAGWTIAFLRGSRKNQV